MHRVEYDFQRNLVKDLRRLFPDCEVIIGDPQRIQGIPDILIIFSNGRFALLECKRSRSAEHQPNQDYYIKKFGKEGFAAFIYPANKDEVLDELSRTFGPRRETRVS